MCYESQAKGRCWDADSGKNQGASALGSQLPLRSHLPCPASHQDRRESSYPTDGRGWTLGCSHPGSSRRHSARTEPKSRHPPVQKCKLNTTRTCGTPDGPRPGHRWHVLGVDPSGSKRGISGCLRLLGFGRHQLRRLQQTGAKAGSEGRAHQASGPHCTQLSYLIRCTLSPLEK